VGAEDLLRKVVGRVADGGGAAGAFEVAVGAYGVVEVTRVGDGWRSGSAKASGSCDEATFRGRGGVGDRWICGRVVGMVRVRRCVRMAARRSVQV